MTATAVGLRGDEARLYARYAPALDQIVSRRVRTSTANIEDACSHAFFQMLRCQPGREQLLGWLIVTATREAVRLERRERRHVSVDEQPDSVRQLAAAGIMEDRIEVLHARETIALAGLRDRETDLLRLRAFGYSYSEIAAARAITPRTVERQLTRATRKLTAARAAQAA